MSILSVHDIQGISAHNNTIRIPSAHTLDVNSKLKIPVWTTSTRPSSPVDGFIGYNSETFVLEIYVGQWFTLGSTALGRTAGRAATSASAILTSDPTATSGTYWIKPSGFSGAAFQVICDMDTDGGGWMHCGTINDSNESINNAAHIWGNPLNPAQDTGIWQDNTTYGSLSLNSDYKSQAWNACPFTQFLIKDQGTGQRNLLYTNAGQITSSNSSFAAFWGSLSWLTNGSETSSSAYSNGRVRAVNITNFGVVDPALEAGNKSVLLLKFGERDGAQDGNKDRSMIAWHRHNSGDNVDLPAGLGCFTNRSGNLDKRDVTPKANWGDYPPNSISGTPHNYTLWVR